MVETPIYDALRTTLETVLQVPKHQVVLVGSATLAARGLRDVRDLDVLAPVDVIVPLVERPEAVVDKAGYATALMYPVGTIQVSDNMKNFATEIDLRAEQVFAAAQTINGWRVLEIGQFVQIKRTLHRDKDVDDLELVAAFFRGETPSIANARITG